VSPVVTWQGGAVAVGGSQVVQLESGRTLEADVVLAATGNKASPL
jgi:hypothetical protein